MSETPFIADHFDGQSFRKAVVQPYVSVIRANGQVFTFHRVTEPQRAPIEVFDLERGL